VDIPRTVDDVTPEWLTEVLRKDGAVDGTAVRSFGATQLEGGVAGTVYRLTLQYTSSEMTAPDSVILKLPAADKAWRELVNRGGFYERESRFYAELVHDVDVKTARVYHVDMDLPAGDHVLLLEDLQHLRDGDQILGCNEEDARAALRCLATLHSRWWNDRRLASTSWLMRPGEASFYDLSAASYAEGIEPGLERLSDWLPSGIEEIARRFVPAVPWFFQTAGSSPITLCHGDFRLGNLFFSDGDTGVEVTAIDWQIVSAQRGASEVAYFMCWSLDTEDRRRIEPGLLEEYHAGLLAGGVSDYPYADFIQDYRRGFLRNLFTILRVAGNMPEEAFETETMIATLRAMSKRMQTLIDWDCGELIPD